MHLIFPTRKCFVFAKYEALRHQVFVFENFGHNNKNLIDNRSLLGAGRGRLANGRRGADQPGAGGVVRGAGELVRLGTRAGDGQSEHRQQSPPWTATLLQFGHRLQGSAAWHG